MRKKIIGMSVVIAVLAILCVQSVAAQVNAWTDKPQYNPGEKGKLEISMLNEYDKPVSIYNITIQYPWYMYDAKEGKWMGNDTIKGESTILKTLDPRGTAGDHYSKEVDFTVPSDGRAVSGWVNITFWTSEAIIKEPHATYLDVAIPVPMSLAGLDTWMMSLIVAVVVCTIILAIVVLLATRRARPYGFEALPPPPKPKAKAE